MAKARPTTSEIDRFLEEVNRRKQQQQARQASAPPPIQQPPPKPRQIPPPQSQKVTAKVQQKQVILPESSIRAAAASSEAIPDTLREFFTQSSTPSSISSSGPLLKELPAAEESKEMQRARALLRSKEGLRSVFILNEILSPPRCKRPFGRR